MDILKHIMENLFYSVIGIQAIIIHLILNHHIFVKVKSRDNYVEKYLRIYLFTVLFYYITDVLWGITSFFSNTKALSIDTVAYYIAMSLSVVFCCLYIISFLNLNNRLSKIIKIFGYLFCILELSVLIVNQFVPIFFYFDSDGTYHAGFFRYLALFIQIFMYSGITLISFIVAFKKTGNSKKRNTAICLFGIVMTLAIICQTLYPLLPLYSIGLMIGTGILHVFIQEDIKNEQYETLVSLAEIFYSIHVIDLVNDTVEEIKAANEVKKFVNHTHGAVNMMKQVIRIVTTKNYLEGALQFTDLNTLSDKMQNKKIVSEEFVGNRVGWFVASFITMEKDISGKPTKVIFTTRIIDEEKKQKEKLIYKTQTDEMTGLLNRRAYEEKIYEKNPDSNDNLIYISIDLNGLKIANDNLGHLAGDELIKGACHCMKKCLGNYGKLYRTGGDEFVAILNCGKNQISDILSDFDNTVSKWSGKIIDSLSVSYGWVSREDMKDISLQEMGVIADKRMYEAKNLYYSKKGLDRRGQAAAHTALCNLYTKILKINITNDSYNIVNLDASEQTKDKGFADTISEWFKGFADKGQVHQDDAEDFLKKTDLEYLKKYFNEGKTSITIFYRRKFANEFKQVAMEMIPADDYSSDNQTLFLYVKNIDI